MICALALMLACATQASAKSKSKYGRCHGTLKQWVACGKANIHKGRSELAFLRLHPEAGNRGSRARLYKHGVWLIRYGTRARDRALAQQRRLTAYSATPPHYNEWMCIHRYEGSWSDAGAPYYGGLQMDWNFMSAYGASLLRAKGPANNWTPTEQMWVAERGLRAQGWGAWPNTARMCGLL